MHTETQPVNVYGTWKLAGEQLARIFAEETGVPTVSIRLGALFGPGRDAGLTATPTTAMKHVACDTSYQIPYHNAQDYLCAPDVGAAVANALIEPFAGYAAFTLPSHTVTTQEFTNANCFATNALQIDTQFKITIGTEEVPFICDLEFQPFLDAFPNVPDTPLNQAVIQSLDLFLREASRGVLLVN